MYAICRQCVDIELVVSYIIVHNVAETFGQLRDRPGIKPPSSLDGASSSKVVVDAYHIQVPATAPELVAELLMCLCC